MTFHEFQATRKWRKELPDDPHNSAGVRGGFEYCGCLYIEDAGTSWYLVIGRDEWTSDRLRDLEVRLYEWAKAEGFGNPTLSDMDVQTAELARAMIRYIRWAEHGNENIEPEDTVGDLVNTIATYFDQQDHALGCLAEEALP